MTTSSNKLCGTDAHLVELSRGNRGEKNNNKNNPHHSAGTPQKFDGSSPCSLHFTCHLLLVSSSIIHFRTQMCSQSHMVVLPLRFHHPHGRWHKARRAPPPAPRRSPLSAGSALEFQRGQTSCCGGSEVITSSTDLKALLPAIIPWVPARFSRKECGAAKWFDCP